jgi:hypothetical protein
VIERKRLIAKVLTNPLKPDARHYVPKPLPPDYDIEALRQRLERGLEHGLRGAEQGAGVPLQLPTGDNAEELEKSVEAMVKAGVIEEMAEAALLYIEPDGNSVLVIRYAADGDFAGDDWHPTVEEAQEDARLEFENALTEWIEVPPDEKDVFAFALKAKW